MPINFLSRALKIMLASIISNSAVLAAEPVSSALPSAETSAIATTTTTTILKKAEKTNTPVIKVSELCEKSLSKFSGKSDSKVLHTACEKVDVLPGCESVQGTPIYHYDRKGESKQASKILVISLIHGDETPAGSVGRFWMERLETIAPRNSWRVIPMLNPDGVEKKTRTNANKVDINRNFPTQDWAEKAHTYWQKDNKSNPRRFPGNVAASEPETTCALKHLEDYKPDFVVSIHTPLKVLDYDGPKVKPPKFDYLPWKSLGHYPGSIGRYMWFERHVPVLTMELKEDLPANNSPWLQLQDIIGFLVSLENTNKKSLGSKNP
jgi:protein MpaA